MNTKYCSTCNQIKNVDCFSINLTKKDGLCSKCKICQNNYAKTHYQKNKERYLNNIKKHKVKKKEFIKSLKLECLRCGENDTRCLDYHHQDPTEKRFAIASEYKNYSIQTLKEEINKCIVLCANCHRKLHSPLGPDV